MIYLENSMILNNFIYQIHSSESLEKNVIGNNNIFIMSKHFNLIIRFYTVLSSGKLYEM